MFDYVAEEPGCGECAEYAFFAEAFGVVQVVEYGGYYAAAAAGGGGDDFAACGVFSLTASA